MAIYNVITSLTESTVVVCFSVSYVIYIHVFSSAALNTFPC